MANNDASDKIENAILEAMSSNEQYEEGDMLVEWVVVAYAPNPGEPDRGDAYPMFFSNGSMPTYRARGLLSTGMKIIDMDTDE